MPTDRAAALRLAEKLLRQGKLESAATEYLKVVQDHPHDWATANTLGDLYARTGQNDKAVEQFGRVAASLHREGFLSKASAVYKKILKLKPDDEPALVQAGDIAARQGLVVDARACWNPVLERRQTRGDTRGVADIRVRLGALDPADFDARRRGARARLELDDSVGAARDFSTIAADLRAQSRSAESIEVLVEAADTCPDNGEIGRELFGALLAAGEFERARQYAKSPELAQALERALQTDGDGAAASDGPGADDSEADLQLVMQAVDRKLRGGQVDEGLGTLRQLLNRDARAAAEITALGWEVGRSLPDVGLRVVDMAAETAVIEGDWASAAAAFREFVARVPSHVPALQRLVELCVDGQLDSVLVEARALLVDAQVAAGSAPEPRAVTATQPVDAPPVAARVPVVALKVEATQSTIEVVRDDDEMDLTELMNNLTMDASGAIVVETQPERAVDLEEVFQSFRDEARPGTGHNDAQRDYERGLALAKDGRFAESATALRAACRSPLLRSVASAALGRLYRDRGDASEAIEWFERAAEAPPPTADDGHAVLYELVVLLEGAGESERALAVCLELQAVAGEYRDVDARIARLTKAQARG